MRQFDVFRNRGRSAAAIPFVVVVQSSLYESTRRRVVLPLVRAVTLRPVPDSAFNPGFTVDDVDVVLNPLEIVSVPIESLGERVDSLSEESDRILRALDELFARSWD